MRKALIPGVKEVGSLQASLVCGHGRQLILQQMSSVHTLLPDILSLPSSCCFHVEQQQQTLQLLLSS